MTGLIPACAGNTGQLLSQLVLDGAHPRLRGEHWKTFWAALSSPGSSPPARGTPADEDGSDGDDGLIPACAGNTQKRPSCRSTDRAHPRLRGEHIWSGVIDAMAAGSSPPARGTPGVPSGSGFMSGLIPACAGNTDTYTGPNSPSAAHPRLRGEHARCATASIFRRGSSPPARGTLIKTWAARFDGRLIPACAGNTRRLL